MCIRNIKLVANALNSKEKRYIKIIQIFGATPQNKLLQFCSDDSVRN